MLRASVSDETYWELRGGLVGVSKRSYSCWCFESESWSCGCCCANCDREWLMARFSSAPALAGVGDAVSAGLLQAMSHEARYGTMPGW